MTTPPPPGYEPTVLMPRRDRGSELAPGTQLQEYVIEGLVGVGGFSIVYRVRDTRLDRTVALKEYIPAALATRDAAGRVISRGARFDAPFAAGLKSFINESRLLARFDHPALVKVHRFWAENGTAYMVMPLYEGLTLKKWLTSLGAPPSEAWLRVFIGEVLSALEVLHRENCFHRDVAPDNLLLLHDRHAAASFLEQAPRPLLLDFGAARRVISEQTQNLTAILKPGYSPMEQYANDATLRQGPWTDVYAFAAVLYAAVTGRVPLSAVARVVKDDLPPAAVVAAGRYSPALLGAIDAGLAVRPADRPQSMAEWRARFDAPPAPPPPPPSAWRAFRQRWLTWWR